MIYSFVIEPKQYELFETEAEQIEKCKEWSLISEKASRTKSFFYRGKGLNLPCTIIGYADQMTAVIEFENKQRHCIHPSFLKEMQAANYGQKALLPAVELAEAADYAAEGETAVIEASKDSEEVTVSALSAVIMDKPEAAAEEAPKKSKSKKAPKLQLPEEKVKMTATVKELTTVPNNFSDNEDEVIIYEAVSIVDPELELGDAWSSHSATLKKLELEIGDTITFDAKVVAKKLTRHPVPYKINNQAKIQKV
ncbi:hypothetical protein [Paenibacillus wynnii]|uniref:Uncharacterized protein n=1 Tax=Paenibacillus wynnii TaxID=268407 RepID=A0A098M2Y6_9BACL|nr:hypothetical protein [Paenibacillus wynnii]KGE16809.1 hypothetical protein PWYN_19140 [Paenibacillus wynnii]